MNQIVVGILTGIGYALLGFGKNKKQDKRTKFSWKQLLKSVVICGIVGGIAGYQGLDLGNFSILMTSSLGITTTKIVDLLYKLIIK